MITTGILYIETDLMNDDKSFNNEINISEDDYVKMLREYSDTINRQNYNQNRHFISYEIKTDNKIKYTSSVVKLYDIKGAPCDINEFYRLQKNRMGVLIIELIENNLNDFFDYEFRYWKTDSMKINNDNTINKDDRIRFLPQKDLKIEINNHVFMLYGCKIYYEYNPSKVALIIQNIEEI